ncbi:hypothetical protein [Rubrobacter xylanophilus]|uniref:hypothetical protein n=1 Tax=Rubrobacter xylanophilus TaxID=49319 RepID=UPI00003A25FC|nr:hypothetical protein [Rubrobacter xylanophilus]
MAQLSPAHPQGLYRSRLDAGLSPRTVRYMHTVPTGRSSRPCAGAWCRATSPRRWTRPGRGGRRPGPEEARALLEALYVLALTTGMRQGELLGLKWEDIETWSAA